MIRYGQEPVYITTNPDGDSWLSTCQEFSEGYTSVPATAADVADLDVEVIAEMLDQCEEDSNAHQLVGVYKALLNILFECTTRPAARKVMMRLMERGGLKP